MNSRRAYYRAGKCLITIGTSVKELFIFGTEVDAFGFCRVEQAVVNVK